MKNHICVLMCELINSMCSKLEGIFKHICLATWTHAYVCMEWHSILIPKKLKNIRNTWNLGWCNVMPPRWCGKNNWPVWRKFGHTPLTNRSNSLEGSWFREWPMHFYDEREIASSYSLQFFLRLTCTTTTVIWNFGKL